MNTLTNKTKQTLAVFAAMCGGFTDAQLNASGLDARVASGRGGHGGAPCVKGAFGSFRGSRRARQLAKRLARQMAMGSGTAT